MKACASWAWPGVAVFPVPIAQTGSYASTSFSCGPMAAASAPTWRRSTDLRLPRLPLSLELADARDDVADPPRARGRRGA